MKVEWDEGKMLEKLTASTSRSRFEVIGSEKDAPQPIRIARTEVDVLKIGGR
jgi:hypothetical protein